MTTTLSRAGRAQWRCGAGSLARWLALLSMLALACVLAPVPAAAASEAAGEAPLVIGHRTIHVFRAPLGAFTPAERAEGARQRILRAFEGPGEGWTSVKLQEQGVLVELDGKPMFTVLPGDVRKLTDDTPDGLANAASRMLQTAWRDARESRDPRANAVGALRVGLALVVQMAALWTIWKLSRWARDAVRRRLAAGVGVIPDAALASRISPLLLGLASRSCVLLAWLMSLPVLFIGLAYGLDQFAYTRAMGEGLFNAFATLLLDCLSAAATALPGMFIAIVIFLVAWIATQIATELFNHVATGRLKLGMLDAHTAPATRNIVNACLWLFALAMAYPYLPGAQTEAFKGLSVILGIMVSIGASGLIGQIASGVILVYTRALSVGEYVRIKDCEGTVTEIGLFVTRVRTGLGSEYALPNALVLSNITRNFSRVTNGVGHVLETTVTIGYDTPWRQVHALLLGAAASAKGIAAAPAPYVVQSALSDFYVTYKLVTQVSAASPTQRAQAASALMGDILDIFNRYGVQIMSPGYFEDPAQPKVVPESKWYAAPARRPEDA